MAVGGASGGRSGSGSGKTKDAGDGRSMGKERLCVQCVWPAVSRTEQSARLTVLYALYMSLSPTINPEYNLPLPRRSYDPAHLDWRRRRVTLLAGP